MNEDDDEKPTRRAHKVRAPQYQSKLPPRRRPPPAIAPPSPRRSDRGDGVGAEARPSRKKIRKSDAEPLAAVGIEEEKVGYGHPPIHSRFSPGRSGNPRGRPKNVRSLKAYVLKVLDEVVEVNELGRIRKMTKREVIARQTVQQAMKGNLKSLAVITTFDPVEDDLPKQDDPLTEHEAAMLARLLGIDDDEDEEGNQ